MNLLQLTTVAWILAGVAAHGQQTGATPVERSQSSPSGVQTMKERIAALKKELSDGQEATFKKAEGVKDPKEQASLFE
jgi:hypothetical protein